MKRYLLLGPWAQDLGLPKSHGTSRIGLSHTQKLSCVEKLRQDGNLRSDMAFPKYDENGEAVVEEGEVAPRLYKGDQVVPLESIVAQTKPSAAEEVKKEIESKK
ncbi:hypothetical protein WICPIJ_005269 [Wickerhamomyces pijperi]|uniref:Uncharacterized protein n=1 Tax=Wickerhamomyces pijperi TaxID=599730 RepID=A0A9P8TM47_WICPI|nr:hypothetical protein WICPIJ_005269 [Wickerhamomyces pijperi]